MTRSRLSLRPLMLAIALATGTAMTSACAQTASAVAPMVSSDGTLVSVSAEASSKRVPDVATISTGVVTRGADTNTAMRHNAEQMAKVMAALKAAGIPETLDLLHRLGIAPTSLANDPNYYGLALTLGGGEVTPIDLATAYNTIASGGRYFAPTPILKITDSTGKVIEEFERGSTPWRSNSSMITCM